jgi:CheY-like chemotaxis protein
VLIVDDIVTNLNVAAGLLAPYRMDIKTCTGGKEAVELLKRRPFDLVLMDHMMPEMDGIEAVQAIRALEDEERRNTPVIALTASVVSGIRDMFLEKGFNDYLAKPVEINKLNEIMEKWISQSKWEEPEVKQETFTGDPGIRIEGLDVATGIAMTGGTLEAYMRVLESYRRDAESRLAFLGDFMGEFGPESLPAFTTQVHALKSASASIGAGALSAMAAELEAAGKKGDREFIRKNLGDFYRGLETLIREIRGGLREKARNSAEAPAAGKAGDLLLGLKAALEAENIKDIDRFLDDLEALPLSPELREAYADISDLVLINEFQQAITAIEKLIETQEV